MDVYIGTCIRTIRKYFFLFFFFGVANFPEQTSFIRNDINLRIRIQLCLFFIFS